MNIEKSKIEEVVERLQYLLEEMEANELEEISTSCNTYGLYEFISFGSKGYLTLNQEELEQKIIERR